MPPTMRLNVTEEEQDILVQMSVIDGDASTGRVTWIVGNKPSHNTPLAQLSTSRQATGARQATDARKAEDARKATRERQITEVKPEVITMLKEDLKAMLQEAFDEGQAWEEAHHLLFDTPQQRRESSVSSGEE
jgi:hypothetical protein